MRGRKPKPTKLKIVEGNRGHRKLDESAEPRPALGIPDPPAWLDAVGKKLWAELTVELDRIGLLAKIDGAALQGCCEAYALAVRCRKLLKRRGMVFTTPNGYPQQRPEVAIERQAWDRFRAFCTEFGLTPASRVLLAVPAGDAPGYAPRPTVDPMDKAIFG